MQQGMFEMNKKAKASCVQAPPSSVWVKGPFAFDKIAVKVLDGTRTYSEEITRSADEYWEGTIKKDRPNLFDGPIWSLVQYAEQACEVTGAKQLHLTMQLSSYRFNLFTHYVGRDMVPLTSRCNGLGVMSLTETSDGYLVLGLRSRKAGAMPWHWHCVPAGVLDAPDPPAVLEKELKEETGFEWATVRCGEVMALISSGEEQGHKPELLFRMGLSVSAVEVHEKHRAAEDSAEHEALIFVKAPSGTIGEEAPLKSVGKLEDSVDMEATIVAAGAAPLFTDLEDFLSGARGPITDLARTALLLLRDSGSRAVLPLPADASSSKTCPTGS
jgi:hypothetical protein